MDKPEQTSCLWFCCNVPGVSTGTTEAARPSWRRTRPLWFQRLWGKSLSWRKKIRLLWNGSSPIRGLINPVLLIHVSQDKKAKPFIWTFCRLSMVMHLLPKCFSSPVDSELLFFFFSSRSLYLTLACVLGLRLWVMYPRYHSLAPSRRDKKQPARVFRSKCELHYHSAMGGGNSQVCITEPRVSIASIISSVFPCRSSTM